MLPDDQFRDLDRRLRAALADGADQLDGLSAQEIEAWDQERRRRERERQAVLREVRDQQAAQAEADRLDGLRGRQRIAEAFVRERR